MPKFNEFIKGFEEKETATKPQEPKVETAPKVEEPKGTPQTPARTFKPLSKAEAEDMRKGGFTEDEYRYNQAKDYAIAMGEEMPDKRKFMQELGEWKEANKQKAQPAPQKQYGGIAGYLQKAGFEPYEVNEEQDYLKVKNKEGKDFEIRNSGKGYNYNVFEDGKQTYQGVPNSAFFENIVGGKNLGEFEKYRFKEAPQAQAPKAPEAPKTPQSPAEVASAHFGKEMTPTKWNENIFETEDGEEWFVGTEEQAREEAKEQIKSLADDMGLESFTPDFQEWILGNALDESFISQLQDEEADYLEQDGEAESAEQIRSMPLDEFAEYLRGNFGDKEFSDLVKRNNAIDWDKVAEEAIDIDGIAHFVSSYDGKEVELPNGLFGYRIN